jgi:hypothetical protein
MKKKPIILPVMDARFNIRKIVQELLCLEDHLGDRTVRCRDCIMKHSLKAEAFAQEGLLLDKTGEHHKDFQYIACRLRTIDLKIMNAYKKYPKRTPARNLAFVKISYQVRLLRKKYIHAAFEFTRKCKL